MILYVVCNMHNKGIAFPLARTHPYSRTPGQPPPPYSHTHGRSRETVQTMEPVPMPGSLEGSESLDE